jgi:hypothetical protein
MGIDLETLRLVAQCLNHYATPGSAFMKMYNILAASGIEVPLSLLLENFSIKTKTKTIMKKSRQDSG